MLQLTLGLVGLALHLGASWPRTFSPVGNSSANSLVLNIAFKLPKAGATVEREGTKKAMSLQATHIFSNNNL